jgi:hypothetical protein
MRERGGSVCCALKSVTNASPHCGLFRTPSSLPTALYEGHGFSRAARFESMRALDRVLKPPIAEKFTARLEPDQDSVSIVSHRILRDVSKK